MGLSFRGLTHQHLGIANITQGDLMTALKATPLASLEAVIAINVIEHFNKDEIIDLLDAIHALLRPICY